MKTLLAIAIAIFSIASAAVDFQEHHDEKRPEKARREFYEFDVVGTRGDRIRRNIGHGTVKVLISPFLAIQWSYRGIRRMCRSVSSKSEVFLTEAGSMQGEKRKLHEVLRGWEGSDD